MDLGPVRVDADLHRVDAHLAHAVRLLLADHEGVGLDLDAELQGAGAFEDLEEVHAHQDLAAAQGEEEDARLGQLADHAEHLRRGHLAVIVVVQVTVYAALVAAVRDVQVDAQGHARIERPLVHFLHQRHEDSLPL